MNPVFLLQEKLRQRHLRAELERSRALTEAATRREVKMPLLDAIAEAARNAGKSGDEVLAEFVAGRASYPTIEAAIAATRKPTAPAVAKPAAASTPAKAAPVKPTAPASGAVYERYRELKKSNPQAATKFFAENKKQIFIEADATMARRK